MRFPNDVTHRHRFGYLCILLHSTYHSPTCSRQIKCAQRGLQRNRRCIFGIRVHPRRLLCLSLRVNAVRLSNRKPNMCLQANLLYASSQKLSNTHKSCERFHNLHLAGRLTSKNSITAQTTRPVLKSNPRRSKALNSCCIKKRELLVSVSGVLISRCQHYQGTTNDVR